MAELFQRDQSVIARHIRNIYKEEELDEESTYAKFAYMGHDGLQIYEVNHYNLDVIISLIKQAKHSVILIDNYINVDTLTMLSNRSAERYIVCF